MNGFLAAGLLLMSSLFLHSAPAPKPDTPAPKEDRPAIDLIGSPSAVSETRGFLATEDSSGHPWIVGLVRDMLGDEGSRISLLMIDPATAESSQYFYTDHEKVTWDSFCLFISSQKKLYTTIGGIFVEFDLDTRKFSYVQPKPIDGNDHCFSMAEDAEGKIYFASYPDARLEVFDPATKKISYVTRLDQNEKYPTTLAVDNDGWIYAGVGPSQGLLIAYHPATKERRQLVPEADLLNSSYAIVLKDTDGKIYSSFAPQKPYEKPYRLLRGGQVEETINPTISKQNISFPPNSLYSFSKDHRMTFPDGAEIEDFDVIAKTFTYRKANGETLAQHFTYQSRGPAISALTAGTDGILYGSTEHPMTFWQYDPASGSSRVLGHLPAVGGGNMTHIINWQDQLVSNTYSEGMFYSFTPALPFQEDGKNANPRLLDNTSPLIDRPRAMLAHPDGRHVLSAGYPAYGLAGGGLFVYDMQDKKRVALYGDDILCPGQAISAMTAMPNGDILFGTSLLTPGGATSEAKDVKVGRFSWEKRSTEWLVAPAPGSQVISSLFLAGDRLLGITSEGMLFAMNPDSQEVEQRLSLAEWGEPVGRRGDTAFISWPDGRLILAMQKGLLVVDPSTLTTKLLVASPIKLRDGAAVLGDRLYLAGFNELISFKIPPRENTPSTTTTKPQ